MLYMQDVLRAKYTIITLVTTKITEVHNNLNLEHSKQIHSSVISVIMTLAEVLIL